MKKFRTSIGSRQFKFKWILLGFLYSTGRCVLGDDVGRWEISAENDGSRRRLLAAETIDNCTKAAFEEFPGDLFTLEVRQRGAICLHILFSCYLFVLLAFVCNDYFVPSIQTLCERLNLSKDVAGATFMATATSSPELFINIVGTFVTEGDLGVGTIVGSAVFNILAVPAFCGLLGGKTIQIDWWTISRDCLAYGITVVLLIVFLSNGYVDWKESLILVILYFIYLIVMYNNESLRNILMRLFRRKKMYKEVNLRCEKAPLLPYKSISVPELYLKVQTDDVSLPISVDSTSQSDAESIESIPVTFWSKFLVFVTWPITFILYLTIPDCKESKNQKLWPATFFMCIVWIGCTSYLVSWMITITGTTFAIPDSVMGLTFLAAGMSVPEAVSSIIVTNQGHGGMGISSSIGSNTFDILLCLGLPWLIKSTFLPAEPGNHIVKINSQGLGYTAMSLLTTLAVLYGSFYSNGFVLDRKIGLTCLITYLIFLVFACLMELNVFFTVNLPLCAS